MSTIEERVAALESALASMTAAEKRIVELPAAASVANDDFVALDGVANGSRRFAASNLGGKAEVMTESEWDDLPDSKLTDGKVYALSGVSPSTQDNPLWQKLGFAALDTTADDCSDAINELNTGLTTLNSNIALTQKIYRFLSSGNVVAGNSFAFTTDYTSDNDVYVDTNDNTKIKFRRSGTVRVSVHIAASPASGATNKRVWLRLVQGTTIVANLIQYGEYTSQSVERIMSVSSSVPVSVQATESAQLNAGGTSPSYIEVQWIS